MTDDTDTDASEETKDVLNKFAEHVMAVAQDAEQGMMHAFDDIVTLTDAFNDAVPEHTDTLVVMGAALQLLMQGVDHIVEVYHGGETKNQQHSRRMVISHAFGKLLSDGLHATHSKEGRMQ